MRARNAVSSQFLRLPSDIVLEIFAQLPPHSVVLDCRLVCHKMEQLSRDRHLWIKYFNQTRGLTCPVFDLPQIGTSEFERIICQTIMLERAWGNDLALQSVPRCWRGGSCLSEELRGGPICIMGEYVILRSPSSPTEMTLFTWLSIRDRDGPIILKYEAVNGLNGLRTFMDHDTNTFYIFSIDGLSLNVLGFQVNASGPYKALETSFPLTGRSGSEFTYLQNGGFVSVLYVPVDDSMNIDVVDMKKRTISRFHVPACLRLDPFNYLKSFVTETHLIYLFGQGRGNFVIFKRPEEKNSNATTEPSPPQPQEIVHLEPIVEGEFPSFAFDRVIIPCSPTSFTVVQVRQAGTGPYASGPIRVTIEVFSLKLLDKKFSFEAVYSLGVPGICSTLSLLVPSSTARYALGVLIVGNSDLDREPEDSHFALKIDLPSPGQNSASETKAKITMTRIHLAHPVDNELKFAKLCHFDNYSGRILLSGFSRRQHRPDIVLDYLFKSM